MAKGSRKRLIALCERCSRQFVVKDQWISREINCPLDGCGKPLKLNPFVCEPSDWLK